MSSCSRKTSTNTHDHWYLDLNIHRNTQMVIMRHELQAAGTRTHKLPACCGCFGFLITGLTVRDSSKPPLDLTVLLVCGESGRLLEETKSIFIYQQGGETNVRFHSNVFICEDLKFTLLWFVCPNNKNLYFNEMKSSESCGKLHFMPT